ncbi:MAG: CHAP domain-containing protein, partial [Acidimicrobiaceae bacterium]|nr:CHAP domain-containing protein [Acidimicrobiaceae bacterium]
MAATPDGKGYWLVAADGGIFTFGDATFYGSMGGQDLNASVVGMAAAPGGSGYWMVGSDGGVFTFGSATFYGSMGALVPSVPIAAVTPTVSGNGYYLLSPDSFNYNFKPNPGERVVSESGSIVGAAESQIGPTTSPGSFCNPYGPCEEWCALFASWTWNKAGIPTPEDGFTGTLFNWVARNQRSLGPSVVPAEGDFVFYGTGPQSSSTSVHMGIVVQTWGDGSVLTIEGDSGPGNGGDLGVTVNGPFLVSHSLEYNGDPVYGYGEPLK